MIPSPPGMPKMSSQTKILYVNHETECGGAEHSLLTLLDGLDRESYEPHLACSMEGPLTDRARECGTEIHLVPMLFQGKVKKLMGMARATLRLRGLIRRTGIQLVHTNSIIAGYCGVLAAKLCSVPSIWHVRDINYPETAKKFCTQAEKVIANSHATAESLNFPARMSSRIEVVYNGVAPAFFEQIDARADVHKTLNVNPTEKLIGMFGRLDPLKGHRDFLLGAKQILSSHSDTTFVVVGETLFGRHAKYREQLETLSRDLGVFGKVRFLGYRSDVAALMSGMDVVVQPSSGPEAFGRTIAEAHAVGRPVVGSSLGGIPEAVEDGVSGFLFPAGDAQELARCVIKLLDNPAMAKSLGDAGRASAIERFTQSHHATQVEAIYASLSPARSD